MNTRTPEQELSAEYQRKVSEFVGREVVHCVSTLVYELVNKAESFPDYQDELYRAYQTEPDYREALEQNGFNWLDMGEACWCDDPDPNELYATVSWESDPQAACEDLRIDTDAYRREVFEHWIVSDFLADRLEERGELILRDFFGLTVWGRACTGQAIMLDRVICDIYDESSSDDERSEA